MKNIFTLFAYLFCFVVNAQQNHFIGYVIDEANEAVTNTELQIIDTNQQLLISITTDAIGKFEFNYDISTFIISIEDPLYETEAIEISTENLIQPYIIQLKTSNENLDEITISVKRPKIKQKIDRLIFDVENSTISNLNTWEILKRTPNITVRNGAIQVRNNNVLVTINDKKWIMSTAELQTFLENTPGDILESIEVITNPPAQYEASGAAVVNIKLKQNKQLGYKSTLYTKYEQSIYAKGLIGLSNFYNVGKWNFAANYYRGMGNYVRKSIDYIIYEEDQTTWKTITNRKDTSKSQNSWNAIVNFQKDSLSSFDFGINGHYQPHTYGVYNIPTTITNSSNEILSEFYTLNSHNQRSNQFNSYLQYNQKINKHQFSVSTQFTNNKKTEFQDIRTIKENSKNQFINDQKNTTQVFSIQVDDTFSDETLTWYNGLKFSSIASSFALDFTDDENGNLTYNPSKSNTFSYNERNYAAYSSLGYTLEKWSLKAGLRAEYTKLDGTANNPYDKNKQSYVQLFPTFYALYTFENTHQLGISYGKRITRPYYAWLNPTKSYYNEYSYFQGDPRLKATITHNIELNYSFKNAVFSPYFRYEKDPAMEINYQIPESKTLLYKYTNIRNEKSFGLQLYKNFDLTSKLSIDLSTNTEYRQQWFWGLDEKIYQNKKLSFNGRINMQIQLQEAYDWTLNTSYFYTSPSIQGSFTISDFSSTSLQTNRTFLNKKLNVALAFNDIFFTEKMKISSKYANQNNYFIDTQETQKVSLTLRYNFGNQNVKALQKAENTDEQNRL